MPRDLVNPGSGIRDGLLGQNLSVHNLSVHNLSVQNLSIHNLSVSKRIEREWDVCVCVWCLGRRPQQWAGAPAQRGGPGCPPAPCTQSSIKGPPHEMYIFWEIYKTEYYFTGMQVRCKYTKFWDRIVLIFKVTVLCSFSVNFWHCKDAIIIWTCRFSIQRLTDFSAD